MLRLAECAGRREVGQKAEVLARAQAIGLPVPAGFVVLPGEELSGPAGLDALLDELGAERLAVRSSALVEDRRGRSAAGLFLSLTAVPRAEVPAAILAVRRSGGSEAVKHYVGAPVEVPVLVQVQVPARRLGVLHLSPDGGALAEERPASEPEWGQVRRRELPGASPLLEGAGRLAQLLGGGQGPIQIEYAVDGEGRVIFLQARPAPVPWEHDPALWPPPLPAGLTFCLDREHNPDPLSAAQAGLVQLVEAEVKGPALRQCVRRGYLYYARLAAQADAGAIAPAELPRRFAEEIVPACDALLSPLEAIIRSGRGQGPQLEQALSAYLGVYARYVGQVAPALGRARAQLEDLLQASLGEGLSRHGALLAGIETETQRRLQALWELGGADPAARAAGLSAYLGRYGACAPCWDVAVPCDDEVPERVLAQAAALQKGPAPAERQRQAQEAHHAAWTGLQARLPPAARAALQSMLPVVRAAMVVAEDDDPLFFRAQRVVRRALLWCGARLCQEGRLLRPAQVFDLPLAVLAGDGAGFEHDLGELARQGAQEREAQRHLYPPERFEGGQPVWVLPQGPVLRGHGVPGPDPAPVRGRALVIRSLAMEGAAGPPEAAALRGAVLVLPVLLPSWAPWLLSAAALVTDSGGALSHGAMLAREGGVPAVLGTRHGTRQITDGTEVVVDAIRGRVYPLDP